LVGVDAFGLEALGWAAGGGRLHDDRVAGVYGEDRLCVRGVVAPGYGRGRGQEGVGGLRVDGDEEGRGDGGCEEEVGGAHEFV